VEVAGLAEAMAFAGHPYAVDVFGTEYSISSLRASDLRAFHAERFVRSRILLSVVGAVDRATVEAAVRSSLTDLPLGSYVWDLPEPWVKEESEFVLQARELPTNYIAGYFGGPVAGSEDYPAFQIAVQALSNNVEAEVRWRGLSYAAGVPFIDRAASGGEIYATTVNPYQTLAIVNGVVERLRFGGLSKEALEDFVESSILAFYLSNETSAQQAAFLARSLLLFGAPWSLDEWVDALASVSEEDVRRVVARYFDNVQYAYLGSVEEEPDSVPPDSVAPDSIAPPAR